MRREHITHERPIPSHLPQTNLKATGSRSAKPAAGLMPQLLGDGLEILGERLLKKRFRCFSEEEIGAFFLAKSV